MPYSKDTWTLQQQVDYGVTAALAGMSHVAKYGREWLYNFYRVHRDWANYDKGPYAFVVPATQRDPFATYEMLDILKFGEVEIHRATAPFSAGGKQYPAGSWVIKTAQPYGAFAKTMLEKQIYPDLRLFPGGPPEPPYDVTGHTLWMLMGVTVDPIDKPFEAPLELLKTIAPVPTPAPARPKGAYLIGPESYGVFKIVAELQKANVPTFRAAKSFESDGQTFAPGTFVIPPVAGGAEDRRERRAPAGHPGARRRTRAGGRRLPLEAGHARRPVSRRQQHAGRLDDVDARAVRHQPPGRDGAGLPAISPPSTTSSCWSPASRKQRIVNGLDMKRNDPAEFGWAAGVGEAGLGQAARVCRERRHAARDWHRGRDRARSARSADREGAARSGAALRPGARPRRRPEPQTPRAPSIARCATRSAARRS